MRDQHITNRIRMRLNAGEVVFDHLEQVFQPRSRVDIDIDFARVALQKEGQLQVAVFVRGFKAPGPLEPRRRIVQNVGRGFEQSGNRAALGFLA